MDTAKRIVGVASLALLVFGFNAMVLRRDTFGVMVLGPLLTGMALGLVWVVLVLIGMTRHSAREGKSLYGLNVVVTSILFLGICIVIYAFAAHGNRSWDLTEEGRRSLSEQTVQVLRNLNKEVNVIAFFLQTDDEFVRTGRDKTARFLEQCMQHTGLLSVEFLDPQVDRIRFEGLKLTHASAQGTVVVQCGVRQKVVMLSGATPRLEERDFTNALINVIRESQPKVCFLTGHGERNIHDQDQRDGGSVLKGLLELEGYSTEGISMQLSAPEIPADCDVLVINGLGLQGPRSDLHPAELQAIEAYMKRGGRMLVMLDPWRKIVVGNQTEQILAWLRMRYGVDVQDGILFSPNSKNKVVVDLTSNTDPFPDAPDSEFRGCFNVNHKITQNFSERALMQIVRTIDLVDPMPADVYGSLLLRTTPDFYNELDLNTLLSKGQASRSASEQAGALPVADAVTAKTDFLVDDAGQTRDARLVVFGDSDFASNSQLTTIPGNLNLMLNTMAWLTESDELIAIRPTTKDDPPVILADSDRRMIVYVAFLGTVQAVVLAGLVTHFLRRKHQ